MLSDVLPGDGVQPLVYVVIKNAIERLDGASVIAAARAAFCSFTGETVRLQMPQMNVFVEHVAPAPEGVSSYRGCVILCPRAESENLRVQDRSRRASGQLQELAADGHVGILCLGLNDKQDPSMVARLIESRFQRHQYRSISGVLMVRAGVHLAPPRRCLLDLVCTLRNEGAVTPLRGNPSLGATGEMVQIQGAVPPEGEVPAYRVSNVVSVVSNPQSVSIPSPDVRSLRPELLE